MDGYFKMAGRPAMSIKGKGGLGLDDLTIGTLHRMRITRKSAGVYDFQHHDILFKIYLHILSVEPDCRTKFSRLLHCIHETVAPDHLGFSMTGGSDYAFGGIYVTTASKAASSTSGVQPGDRILSIDNHGMLSVTRVRILCTCVKMK